MPSKNKSSDQVNLTVNQNDEPKPSCSNAVESQLNSGAIDTQVNLNEGGDLIHSKAKVKRKYPKTRSHQQARTDDHLSQIERISNQSDDQQNLEARLRDKTLQEKLQEQELKYGANHVIKLFVPVSICMLFVIISIHISSFYTKTEVYLPYTPYTDQNVDTPTKVWQSFANAFIVLFVVILTTFLLIFCYKCRCYKAINIWLLSSSAMLILMFVTNYSSEILKIINYPIDVITAYFFMWNIAIVGLISIHCTGPLVMQQSYLLIVSCMMSLTFIKLIPDWSIWTILGVISVWDLVAVLCPNGPLRMLVETAQKRKEPIFPALIYSSGVVYFTTACSSILSLGTTTTSNANRTSNDNLNIEAQIEQAGSGDGIQIQANPLSNQSSTDNVLSRINNGNRTNATNVQPSVYYSSSENLGDALRPSTEAVTSTTRMIRSTDDASNSSSEQGEEEEVGVKLGLGDFIFYSVLVGKASVYNDWNTTIACFVAILIGLSLTLFLLAICNKALPALPISITFGLVFYFSTSVFVKPLTEMYNLNHILI